MNFCQTYQIKDRVISEVTIASSSLLMESLPKPRRNVSHEL